LEFFIEKYNYFLTDLFFNFNQQYKSMTEKASRKLSLPASPVSPRQPLKKTFTTPSKEYKGDIG
jgi:hypothetical protein